LSKIEVNAVEPQCGTTLTLGASGDTVTLGSGASQSGFGRTGTVDWDTTAKTASFTAVSGDGFFTDTSGGAITATLPASPSAGDIVAFADYANTWDTNNLTIGRNSSNIEGEASDFVCNQEGATITFVYVDATKGWICTNSGNSSQAFINDFIAATGGTITECGDYRIHTFTGPGTFTVICGGTPSGSNTVDYLVVAGGGGGAGNGGGGGAGGTRFYVAPGCAPGAPALPRNGPAALPVTEQAYPITVGSGANGNPGVGSKGSNSIFSTITSTGGGGGGFGPSPTNNGPADSNTAGGSGGGAGRDSGPPVNPSSIYGRGNTPPTTPAQGTDGGSTGYSGWSGGGGGGGFIGAGGNGGGNNTPGNETGGNGGTGGGLPAAVFGSNGVPCGSYRYYAGGGGGGIDGSNSSVPSSAAGLGGLGGGGNSGVVSGVSPYGPRTAVAGTANTGGGGGGQFSSGSGANGGSGIVIIRYKFQ